MIQRIVIEEVELIAYDLAKRLMEWDEPIPSFDTRFPNVLESCIAVPFQSFENNEAYKGLAAKSSILFYLLIKNHPFKNGNKRIAVTTLLYFLSKNRKWLKVDNVKLYNFAKWVAESPAELKDPVVLAINKFIENYLVDY